MFSIYRLLLRLPHYLFLLLLAGLVALACSEVVSLFRAPTPLSLSPCLADYFAARNPIHNRTESNDSNTGNSSSPPESVLQPQPFLDEGTILHIRMANVTKCEHQLNYDYEYGNSSLPLGVLLANEQLAHLERKPKAYLERHNISYDLINIPITTPVSPLLSWLPSEQHQTNQLLVRSLVRSLPHVNNDIIGPFLDSLADIEVNLTANMTPRTIPTAQINELFLVYFYASG